VYYVPSDMPRRSSAPARTLPFATFALVLANLVVYLHELVIGGQKVCDAYGLIPARLVPETLLTSLFLHDPGNLTHLLGNMAFLAVFGTLVEGSLGHLRFLALYGAAGVLGGFSHVLVDPSSTSPLVGASGAVFGILAVATVLRPRLLGFAVAFVGIEIWHAFAGGDGAVSFGCHLGGFFAGFLLVTILRATGSEVLEAT